MHWESWTVSYCHVLAIYSHRSHPGPPSIVPGPSLGPRLPDRLPPSPSLGGPRLPDRLPPSGGPRLPDRPPPSGGPRLPDRNPPNRPPSDNSRSASQQVDY